MRGAPESSVHNSPRVSAYRKVHSIVRSRVRVVAVLVVMALLITSLPNSGATQRISNHYGMRANAQSSFVLQTYRDFSKSLTSIATWMAGYLRPKLAVATTPYQPVAAYLASAPLFIDAPSNLTVTSVSSTAVSLSWSAPAGGADHYLIERSGGIGGPFSLLTSVTSATYNDSSVTNLHAYLYRVRAVSGTGAISVPSNMALGTAISFDFQELDNQLIKAQHFYDVRTAINLVRQVAGLPNASWARGTLLGLEVKADDVNEMRTALDAALAALSIPVSAYEDPTLTVGSTLIKATHLEQLQSRSTRGSSTSSGPLDSDSSTAELDPLNEVGGGGENPLSRNFNWNLPFLSLLGRAGLDLGLTLSYNSLVWTKFGSNIMWFNKDNGFPGAGFRLGFPVIQQLYFNSEVGTNAFLLIGSDGSRTELRQVGTSALYEAADSSHLLLDASSMNLRTTDGMQLSYSVQGSEYKCTQVKDRNGNYISVSYTQAGQINTITDTLGRVITFEYTNGLLTSINQLWNQGSPSQVTHYWARFEYTTNTPIDIDFGNMTVLGAADNSTITTLSKVTLADDSHFDFSYTSWGQVWKVSQYAADNHLLNYRSYDLPQTAALQHVDCPRFQQRRDWAQYWNGDTDGTPATNEEALTQFEIPVGDTWTMPGASSTVDGTRAQVTLPDGTSNKIYFIGIAGTGTGWQRSLPALVNTYDGAGVLQRQAMTTWTQDNTVVSYPLDPRVTETNTYDPAGNRARTQITYQQFTFANGTSCQLPRDVYEYAANATTVLRSTRVDYNTSTSYSDRRILGLVSERRLYEGDVNNNGVLMSKVAFNYDEGGSLQGNDAPVQHDNTNYNAAFVTGRANLSSVKRYDVTNIALFTTTSTKYNTAGAVVSSKDDLNHEVTVSYADAFSDGITTHNTFAYPTKVTDPDNYYSTSVYNFDFGAMTKTKTPPPNETGTQNPQAGPERTITYDVLGRIERTTNLVNNAYTRFEYASSQMRIDAYSTIQEGLGEAHSFEIIDGAGRVIARASDHNLNTFSGQKIVYDVMGRVIKTSNPTETTASGAPSQWNTTGDDEGSDWIYTQQTYDWKGRPLVTTNQDGTAKIASYTGCGCAGGEVMTLTDEGTLDGEVAKKRQQKLYSDVLGRVVKTELLNWEGGSVYSTTVNTYNIRDQITLIKQYAGAEGSGTFQETTWNYDGFGRLQSQHRPEQDTGTATIWTYNTDDTVSSVADARGAVTSYTYNSRHLVTNISYSAPSPIPIPGLVTYAYDAAGNRTSMQDSSGSTIYQYDQLSRMNFETRLINGLSAAQTIGYTYTLSGKLKSLTDPQGRIINYDYDKVGRLAAVTGSGYSNTSQFISNYQYRAWGAPKHFNSPYVEYNTTGSIDYSYNSRLQLTHFEWVKPYSVGNIDVYKSDYQYYADGRIKFISDERFAPYEQEIFHNFDRGYRYDHVGRLTTALTGDEARAGSTPDGPYKETYQYDVWNHMNNRVNRIWSKPLDTWSGNYINNRNYNPFSLWQYDADGNATRDDNGPNTFDAAGRKTAYASSRYYNAGGAGGANPNETWNASEGTNIYDGDGQAVKQVETSGTTQWDAYLVRSTVLGGALIFWKEVETNPVYAPGWSNTLNFSPIYADGERIAQSMDGNVTFEFEEPFTGRRRDVEPDPLGQPVGTSDPGPEEPADPGGYPEPHEFGNVEDPGGGCTMDGITIDCNTAMRFVNSDSAYQCQNNNCSRRWAQVQVKYFGDDGLLRVASGGGWIGPNDIPDGTHTFTGGAAKEAYRAFKWADAIGFVGRIRAAYFFGMVASMLGDGSAVYSYSFQDPQDPQNPQQPATPQKKLDPSHPECQALARKINNILRDIQHRAEDILKDKLKLPLNDPGPLRNSIEGHRTIIKELVDTMERRRKEYDDKCGGGGPGGSPVTQPAGNPARIPSPRVVPVPPIIIVPAPVPRPVTPSMPVVVPLPVIIIRCIVFRDCGQGGQTQTE